MYLYVCVCLGRKIIIFDIQTKVWVKVYPVSSICWKQMVLKHAVWIVPTPTPGTDHVF